MREITFTAPKYTHKQFKEAMNEAKELLMKDGWKPITQDIGECFVFAMNDVGAIEHRYLTWDSEYSDWHGCELLYPCFWHTDKCNLVEDYDSDEYILICDTIPKRTENTIKALEIYAEYLS